MPCRVFSTVSHFTDSNTFLRSIKATYIFPPLLDRYFWVIACKVNTWSVVEHPLLKPA